MKTKEEIDKAIETFELQATLFRAAGNDEHYLRSMFALSALTWASDRDDHPAFSIFSDLVDKSNGINDEMLKSLTENN